MGSRDADIKQVSNNIPRHVAIIMDGNGRWAQSRNLPRVEGHSAGVKTVRSVVEEARRIGIRYLTLYAFSTENWQRPEDEVASIMKLFEHYLKSEQELLINNDIRLRVIGNRQRLSAELNKTIAEIEHVTKPGKAMDLILAISYGGREELIQAAKSLAIDVAEGKLDAKEIDETLFKSKLYTADIPDPDVLIRTSDEFRISNFLLWQLAYAEIVVTATLWPEFSKDEFKNCLEEYASRSRRYGLTEEQIAEQAKVA